MLDDELLDDVVELEAELPLDDEPLLFDELSLLELDDVSEDEVPDDDESPELELLEPDDPDELFEEPERASFL